MGGGDRWAWFEFPKTSPRPVQGGIKARSERGSFATTWWGKRWIDVLEGFGWSNRLQRGRRYARLGQVVDFRLRAGCVEAKVQGSRPRPYHVQIRLSALPPAAWRKALEALALKASFTADLLAGEMPRELEGAFQRAGVPLFPERDDEFRAECDCPDWANPCKHIAALHYILGEAFDRDPFLLLALRGKPREEFLAELRSARTGRPGPPPGSTSRASAPKPGSVPSAAGPAGPSPSTTSSESPFADPSGFWGPVAAPNPRSPAPPPPSPPGPRVPHALLRALGTPAALRGRSDLSGKLEGAYDVVSRMATDILLPPRSSEARSGRGRAPPPPPT